MQGIDENINQLVSGLENLADSLNKQMKGTNFTKEEAVKIAGLMKEVDIQGKFDEMRRQHEDLYKVMKKYTQ